MVVLFVAMHQSVNLPVATIYRLIDVASWRHRSYHHGRAVFLFTVIKRVVEVKTPINKMSVEEIIIHSGLSNRQEHNYVGVNLACEAAQSHGFPRPVGDVGPHSRFSAAVASLCRVAPSEVAPNWAGCIKMDRD